MTARIQEHVGERISYLRRVVENDGVIPIAKDFSLPLSAVVRFRDADGETLHPAGKGFLVARFDDEVDVIGKHGELNEPHTESLRSLLQGLSNPLEAALRAKGRQV